MSDKPRIVILSTFLTPFRSGAEACAEEIALRLCDRYDITIVTARMRRDLPKKDLLPFDGAQGKQGKVPVQRVGFGFPFDKWIFPFIAPFAVKKLRDASRQPARVILRSPSESEGVSKDAGGPPQHDVFIIHAILETFAGLALHFCKFLIPSAKRILTLQTTNRSFLKGMVVRSPHHVTAISTALVTLARNLGRSDITHIPNGVDLSAIPEAQKVPGRILFVGRLEKWKGVDVLLKAFAPIDHSTAHLRIVGDGSERKTLESLARELHIEDRVTFVGQLPPPAVYQEFAQAEIFCGLSRSEAFGNVFIEAQAAGCAVIGTNVSGIPDIVEDGATGLLVPPDDEQAAERALRQLLGDTSLRQKLAQSGVQNARQYDWPIITEEYSRVYELVLSG